MSKAEHNFERIIKMYVVLLAEEKQIISVSAFESSNQLYKPLEFHPTNPGCCHVASNPVDR